MDNVLWFYTPDIFAQHTRTREGKLQVHEYHSPISRKCGPNLNGRAGAGGVRLRGSRWGLISRRNEGAGDVYDGDYYDGAPGSAILTDGKARALSDREERGLLWYVNATRPASRFTGMPTTMTATQRTRTMPPQKKTTETMTRMTA
jgi:hypothetical protein